MRASTKRYEARRQAIIAAAVEAVNRRGVRGMTTVPESIRIGSIQKLHRITMRFSSIVGDGIADGSIRPVDAFIAAEMITGAVNAAVELRFWAPGISAEAVSHYYLKPLFAGLDHA